jgi:hypothetical protein
MNSAATPTPAGGANESRDYLAALRQSMLHLHKTLIDSERTSYEQTFGKVESQNQFLQLLIKDPWFVWLHPLSELVVAMDEALEGEVPLTAEQAKRFAEQARGLLKASEQGEGFERSYYEALQREPDVVLAHAAVTKCLNAK